VLRQFNIDNLAAMQKGADNLAPLVLDNSVAMLRKTEALESELRCVAALTSILHDTQWAAHQLLISIIIVSLS
jgi:hypothetical protein